MNSKLTEADAREWLESLQQVGEGWYRQVALAVRANAHRALGMDRREFARQIGQRMIDPRPAIIELHREGHSYEAIADVLGISKNTVRNALVDEGLVEGELNPFGALPPATREALTVGATDSDSGETVGATDSTNEEGVIDVESVDPEERIAELPADLAERVRSGTTGLDEAEMVVRQRARRLEKYLVDVRNGLDLFLRMIGHPVPDELREGLTEEQQDALGVVLRALEEGATNGRRAAA